jgi:hypothetical protein
MHHAVRARTRMVRKVAASLLFVRGRGVTDDFRTDCRNFARMTGSAHCRRARGCALAAASLSQSLQVHTMMRTALVTVAFATLTMTAAPGVLAQTDLNANAPDAAREQAASPYSDTELKAFVGAALDVVRIKDTYTPLLEAATTPEQEMMVKQQASQEMTQAVESKGLSVDRFQEILVSAQADPELAQRINQQLQSR